MSQLPNYFYLYAWDDDDFVPASGAAERLLALINAFRAKAILPKPIGAVDDAVVAAIHSASAELHHLVAQTSPGGREHRETVIRHMRELLSAVESLKTTSEAVCRLIGGNLYDEMPNTLIRWLVAADTQLAGQEHVWHPTPDHIGFNDPLGWAQLQQRQSLEQASQWSVFAASRLEKVQEMVRAAGRTPGSIETIFAQRSVHAWSLMQDGRVDAPQKSLTEWVATCFEFAAHKPEANVENTTRRALTTWRKRHGN